MASGDILSVSIDSTGAFALVTVEGWSGKGGTIAYDFGTPGSTATSKFYFTVTSEGYDSEGNLGTVSRTVYGTAVARKAYPNDADLNETDVLANLRIRVALSQPIFNDDKSGGAGTSGTNPTYTIAAGWADPAVGSANAARSASATNNSTLDYPKVVGQWVQKLGSYRRLTEDFQLGFNARHPFGLAAVRFTTDDASANQDDQYITAETAYQYSRSGLYGSYYIASVGLSQFADGDTLTSRARAYPVVGDADSVLDTNANGAVDEAYQVSDITNVCDQTNTPVIAYVSSAGTASGTNSTDDATAAADPWLTITQALAGSPTPDIVKVAGSGTFEFEYTGAALSDTGYFREITAAAGATATLTKTGGNRNYSAAKRLKVSGLDFSSVTSWLDGGGSATSCLWFDDCGITFGAMTTGFFYNSRFARFTDCDFDGTDADFYKQFSTTRCVALVEGCTEDAGGSGLEWNCCFRAVANSFVMGMQEVASASPVGTSDRCMYESNRLQVDRDDVAFLFTMQVTNGISLCGNIAERYAGAEGSSALVQVSADNVVTPCNNFLVGHNTFAGQRFNAFYQDTGTSEVNKYNNYMVGVAATMYNIKTDTFGTPNANRVGNWACVYGCGYTGCVWDGASGSDFRNEYDGYGVSYDPSFEVGWANIGDIAYEDDQSDAGGGAGGGDYTPAEGSSLKGTLPAGFRLMAYDMNGREIRTNGTGDIGAVQTQAPAGGSRGRLSTLPLNLLGGFM